MRPAHSSKSSISIRQKRDFVEAEATELSEPARKSCKLIETGDWIERTLAEASLRRKAMGQPDPDPLPAPTPPPGHISPLRHDSSSQYQRRYSSSRHLSLPDFARSPGLRSEVINLQASPAYSASTPSHSPVPSQATVASTPRRVRFSPPDTAINLTALSDQASSTRANSANLDDGGPTVTFEHVYDVPHVVLPARRPAGLSKLEQLPLEIFNRIMMHCSYKAQTILKKCSYTLYKTVDLEAVPSYKKTAEILFEECCNPINFPKKLPKAPSSDDKDEERDTSPGKESGTYKNSGGRILREETELSSAKKSSGKSKAHPDTRGKWGCYCCYKILPACYFEGQLLEDKEGRKPKNHSSRGAATAESDRKVDMSVDYVQILKSVPSPELPDWLTRDRIEVDASSVETYMRKRVQRGVNCDDLRAHYQDITKEAHLVAPLRGVNPIYTRSSEVIPEVPHERSPSQLNSTQKSSSEVTILPAPLAPSTAVPRQDSHRPLYRLPVQKTVRADTDSASYTYEITVPFSPKNCKWSYSKSPTSEPVGRVCLPSGLSPGDTQEPTLQAGDVLPLRRVCIPCGTKYDIYRRECNRRIVSMTDVPWWVCGCRIIRLANESTGCPACKKKVVY